MKGFKPYVFGLTARPVVYEVGAAGGRADFPRHKGSYLQAKMRESLTNLNIPMPARCMSSTDEYP